MFVGNISVNEVSAKKAVLTGDNVIALFLYELSLLD